MLNLITAVNQITVIAAGQSPAAAMWEPSLDFLFKMHSNASLLHVTCFCACLKYVYKNPCLYGAEQCAFRPSVLSTMESVRRADSRCCQNVEGKKKLYCEH